MGRVEESSVSSREKMLKAGLSQVRRIAEGLCRRLPKLADFDDLYQEGILGLLDAMEKFNPEKQVAFTTYAGFRIRGAILDSVRQQLWEPRREADRRRGITESVEESDGQADGLVTSGASPPRTRASNRRREAERPARLRMIRFSEMPPAELTGTEEPRLASKERPVSDTLAEEEEGRCLWEAVKLLPKRERRLLELHYRRDVGFAEIAESFGIGKARVSQLHQRALARLRFLCLRSPVLRGAYKQLA